MEDNDGCQGTAVGEVEEHVTSNSVAGLDPARPSDEQILSHENLIRYAQPGRDPDYVDPVHRSLQGAYGSVAHAPA